MSGVLLYIRYAYKTMSINKVSEELYQKYHDGVPWSKLTNEQACMSIGSAITKTLNELIELENSGKPLIAPVRGMNAAKKEALIRLSADVAAKGIELMLKRKSN